MWMSMSESVTEFLRFFFPTFATPTSCSVRVRGEVVVVGSCGGTDSGTSASPPSYPVFTLSWNVMNECCMKGLIPASCRKWTSSKSLRPASKCLRPASKSLRPAKNLMPSSKCFRPAKSLRPASKSLRPSSSFLLEMDLKVCPESCYYYYYYYGVSASIVKYKKLMLHGNLFVRLYLPMCRGMQDVGTVIC